MENKEGIFIPKSPNPLYGKEVRINLNSVTRRESNKVTIEDNIIESINKSLSCSSNKVIMVLNEEWFSDSVR